MDLQLQSWRAGVLQGNMSDLQDSRPPGLELETSGEEPETHSGLRLFNHHSTSDRHTVERAVHE